MSDRIRLLMSGDLHIGRSSSRVKGDARPNDLRAATAWYRLVDFAIREKTRVVCLSGDVADQDNKFWEAIGPLEEGIRRLAKAGIQTIAVSGNHDYDVLARLADQMPSEHFTLLGRGGVWQRRSIYVDGHPKLHVDGWSFPSQYVDHSPPNTYAFEPDANVPTLGMVHGDLDVPGSRYAPLDSVRLRASGVNGWLYGHMHTPRLMEGSPWLLYPGSPQALDPGETGPHGPWIVEVSDGKLGRPKQLPLSTVWYDNLDIDISAIDDEASLEGKVHGEIRKTADRIAERAGANLVHISLRLRLAGATSISSRVADVANSLIDELSLQAGPGTVRVEKVAVQTTPAIDLNEHAKKDSLPGSLARLLLELGDGELSSDVGKLVGCVQDALEQISGAKEFAQLDQPQITESTAREYLRTQARELLTQLTSQLP